LPALDLEIALQRRDTGGYTVALRLDHSEESLADPVQGPAPLDLPDLLASAAQPGTHGGLLTDALFADPDVRKRFDLACSLAEDRGVSLRVRLFVHPDAKELHGVRWETLRKPGTTSPLLTSERILFSRFLSSSDLSRDELRREKDRRALVVIADPDNLAGQKPGGRVLERVDVAGELGRATVALEPRIPVTPLDSGGRATLNDLITHVGEGYDILYLVCHGAVIDEEPWLWLEDAKGQFDRVKGESLVTRLSELRHRPRLVVLASCQSAGRGTSTDDGALAALGPSLAQAGIPAVLAMQGDVSMQTVAGFMPVFFAELSKDGQIDRAAARARGAVRDQPDSWMPVVFLRLKTGRISWYEPGFTKPEPEHRLKKWRGLINSIHEQHCTPILGPGLTEFLFGSRREVAQDWARKAGAPLAAHQQEDLHQVAQYVAVQQDPAFARSSMRDLMREELLRRHRGKLTTAGGAALHELMAQVWAERQQADHKEPHRILARLPFPLYITTNPDCLLEAALRETPYKLGRKDPQTDFLNWQGRRKPPPSVFDRKPGYRPSEDSPLVYHFFGHLDDINSLVLTEDDYFEYLINLGRYPDLVPPAVECALTDASLLFLGFRLDDWPFRILFRSVTQLEGGRPGSYTHVAVQIDPAQGRPQDVERARRYLEDYFQKAQISIYRGGVDDFVQDLADLWRDEYRLDMTQ
jgi:hypothetical protein